MGARSLAQFHERYHRAEAPLERYFSPVARGLQESKEGLDVPALEMTKWFDTNYHYIVPELEEAQAFALDASKIVREIDEARALGVEPRPVIPGPVTFLLLSKLAPGARGGASTLSLLPKLVPIYQELLSVLASRKLNWVQLDEPCLALELNSATRRLTRPLSAP